MSGNQRWRNGVAGAIGGFILLVTVMVGISLSQRVDLVAEDYYERSLRHDMAMASVENTRRLGESFALRTQGDELLIRFPPTMEPGKILGSCLLYRPSDRSMDRSLRLAPDSAGVQHVGLGTMARGLWKAKLLWSYRGEAYAYETPVILK